MMSLCEKYAVICAECITNPHSREYVLASLEKSFDVMEITLSQMENYFCGNILQVRNNKGDYFIAMSKKNRTDFGTEQIRGCF
jgi:hypothetical protein